MTTSVACVFNRLKEVKVIFAHRFLQLPAKFRQLGDLA